MTISLIAGSAWSGSRPLITAPPPNGGPATFYDIGDGYPALNGTLWWNLGIAQDAAGNIFISDYHDQLVRMPRARQILVLHIITSILPQIRMVDPNGVMWTVAGTTASARTGDARSAVDASLLGPRGLAIDAFGNLVVAEVESRSVRMIAYSNSPDCPPGYACPCALRPVPCASPASVCPSGTSIALNVTTGFVATGIPVDLPPAVIGYTTLVRP